MRLLDSQMNYIPGGTVRIDFIRIFRFSSGVVDFSKSAWSFSKFLDIDCKTSIGTEYELSSDSVQVNLCQKHLFSHQLTHNMTKDCSLIYQFST